MKIYETRVRWNDDNEEENTLIAQLENFYENELYFDDKYDELFAGTEYCDDDICYYGLPDLIPVKEMVGKHYKDMDFTILEVYGEA